MTSIIVVFPKQEDGKSIRNLLKRHGYEVAAVCTLGSQALNDMDMMNDGIVICGYKFADMSYQELRDLLPSDVDMLLLASLKVQDLMNTVEMMCMNQMRKRKKRKLQPRKRSKEELQILEEAKAVLMERNHMTEEAAHRYIQKCSMDSGTSLVETAQMVLSMSKL